MFVTMVVIVINFLVLQNMKSCKKLFGCFNLFHASFFDLFEVSETES